MYRIKQWLKSWTVNFGLLLQVAAAVQAYVGTLGNPEFTMFIGIVVILLRAKTTTPLSKK